MPTYRWSLGVMQCDSLVEKYMIIREKKKKKKIPSNKTKRLRNVASRVSNLFDS